MTELSHGPSRPARVWAGSLIESGSKAMWASLAIVTMWLAVLFDAIFGPDLVTTTATTTTTVPSAVCVAFFAFLATGAVAYFGFRSPKQ